MKKTTLHFILLFIILLLLPALAAAQPAHQAFLSRKARTVLPGGSIARAPIAVLTSGQSLSPRVLERSTVGHAQSFPWGNALLNRSGLPLPRDRLR